MPDREMILKKATKLEDKLFLSRIFDKAVKAENESITIHTDFLDPYQRTLVDKALWTNKDVQYTYYGGYTGAERAITVFSPVFLSIDTSDCESYLKTVYISLKGRESLNHRDYLGSLMGLGIKREKIGDILVYEDSADVIVLSEIADYIKYNLAKIGSSKVECEVRDTDDLQFWVLICLLAFLYPLNMAFPLYRRRKVQLLQVLLFRYVQFCEHRFQKYSVNQN